MRDRFLSSHFPGRLAGIAAVKLVARCMLFIVRDIHSSTRMLLIWVTHSEVKSIINHHRQDFYFKTNFSIFLVVNIPFLGLSGFFSPRRMPDWSHVNNVATDTPDQTRTEQTTAAPAKRNPPPPPPLHAYCLTKLALLHGYHE